MAAEVAKEAQPSLASGPPPAANDVVEEKAVVPPPPEKALAVVESMFTMNLYVLIFLLVFGLHNKFLSYIYIYIFFFGI